MKKLLCSILCLISFSANAMEGYLKADHLYTMLKSKEVMDKANAVGYIFGVFDGTQGITHCSPPAHPVEFVEFIEGILAELTEEERKRIRADMVIIKTLEEVGTKCKFV